VGIAVGVGAILGYLVSRRGSRNGDYRHSFSQGDIEADYPR
jgi:hypothetical protein